MAMLKILFKLVLFYPIMLQTISVFESHIDNFLRLAIFETALIFRPDYI